MSASHASRARAGSGASGQQQLSARGRNAHMGDFTMPTKTSPPPPARYFEPSAATASMFLYAQGASIVCAHHDTLTIERRFARHGEEVQLLAVDNVSDVGAGRLVVSYDAGQTAIVWDILTGDEVARFASYENLTCAAWMRNGNVAFGNIQGNVILFEPTTSEHISARTIDQISITAIAPAADCRTFAIGYQNGSLLIATLQPRFTILHNLTTSRGPSPIVTLAWHASSSRQKSDMLAVQTNDGDLRVWSVSKSYNADDPAKVVRLLKRTENYLAGPNWMGWSKNGRIIQYSEGETISWDVRTKHVTYDTIPTLDNIRGLAVYGPGASLFTLGANNTVQQFDLNAPAMLVANVQHPANLLPPSPPISLEEQEKGNASMSETESTASIAIHADLSEEENMSPLARLVKGEIDSDAERYRTASPVSSRSRSSVSISSSSSQTPARGYPASVQSRGGMTEHTYISAGSSLASAAMSYRDRGERGQRESFSTSSSISMGSSHYRSRHRPSRLRNEIPRSPEDSRVVDLFKFTKSRLQDVPFKAPFSGDTSHLTNDDLRGQMLSTIFGWNKEVEELIRDEMSRHPLGSTNRILLAKWLGDITTDIMAMGSENMTSSDWMLLALSGIGGQQSQHKLGRAYVQRLLENGDVHAAATIMIGLGDHNDAIEIYISHKRYMEALILSCLFFPAVWERQEAILRKWGEWAVQHGQQQLAIRCFACTNHESSEPWTSPSAQQITFQSLGQTMGPNGELLSPPMSPPSVGHGPQRSVAKASSLKLITTFGGDQPIKNKFLSAVDDGRTPLAGGPTPIADSAMSPGGDPATAVLRGNRSQFATPASARPSGGGFSRQRLPSIGEAPDQSHRELLTAVAKPTKDPYSEAKSTGVSIEMSEKSTRGPDSGRSMEMLRSHTASPRTLKDKNPPPSPSPAAVVALMEGPKRRNGSRTRIPEGLDLSLPRFHEQVPGDLTSPEQSAGSSVRYHWPSRRRGPASVSSSVTSASAASSVAGARGQRDAQTGRTLDDYLNGLDSTRANHARALSREGRGRVRESSRKRSSLEDNGDRGRGESRGYTPKGGKRSPKSPVPMSPEDLINLATPRDEEGHALPMESENAGALKDLAFEDPEQPPTVKKVTAYRDASKSRQGSRNQSRNGRGASRDGRATSRDGRATSRDGRRARSPEKSGGADRGRSATRGASKPRSPSSPVPMPMSAGPSHTLGGSESEEDLRQALEAQEKFRHRKSRSTSRGPRGDMMSPQSARSATAPAPWSDASRSRQVSDSKKGRSTTPLTTPLNTTAPMVLVPATYTAKTISDEERRLKKEAAARELEERRRSLALRPAAPPIPHPDELSPAPQRTPPGDYNFPRHGTPPLSMDMAFRKEDLPSRSGSADPIQGRSMYANRGENPRMGLPATPKAMRLVLESDASKHNVPVPPLPAAYQQQHSPPIIHSNQPSPKKVESEEPPMTLLLPSTVYTPPPPASSRTQTPAEPLPRSNSAPPRDLAPPSGGSTGRHTFNKPSLSGRRPSYDSQMGIPPPPPPPAPPVLKELQHLAQPPPPPPAPLPHGAGPKPVVYGGSTGMIEIVMDDEQQQQPGTSSTPAPIEPPAPTSSRNGHHRGRSSVDNSIGARITRATERMRSASRNRTRDNNPRVKSPETIAPYESVPPLSYHMRTDMTKSPILRQEMAKSPVSRQDMAKSPVYQQVQQTDFRTGLHKSELI